MDDPDILSREALGPRQHFAGVVFLGSLDIV
jgi:hypothetical protein